MHLETSSTQRTVVDADVVRELCWARENPDEVLDALTCRFVHYRGLKYFPPSLGGDAILTQEGPAAVSEAIEFLKSVSPMGRLQQVEGLDLAAEDHVADIGSTGARTNTSSDGTTAGHRLSRYGSFSTFGEIVWYMQFANSAREMVLNLIVNDGAPCRECRLKIYNEKFTQVGFALGPHVLFGTVAALEFTEAWQSDANAISKRKTTGPVLIPGRKGAQVPEISSIRSLGNCVICASAITHGSPLVEVIKLGGKIHKDCFNCSMCDVSLARLPCFVDGLTPFCKRCHLARSIGTCSACGKSMRSSFAEGDDGKKLHPACKRLLKNL